MNGAISNEVMRGFEDMDWSILEVLSLYELDNSLHVREPCRDSFMTGPRWVAELLNGNTNRIYESLGMERHVFINLCNLMKHRGWLQDSRYVRVDEQLAMFVQALQGSCSTRRRCERFQHSGETVSKFFKIVLKAFLNLAKENIHAPNMNVEQPEIRNNRRHHPYFRNCVGAIDGTHVDASVPANLQTPYRNRKHTLSQNVMAICSFDMKFTYVHPGWEGSANDCRVLADARRSPSFPHPPPGKYYLVDSGYSSQRGYLTPFKGDRYHLRDYRGTGREPRTAKELFNHRHSSLRNVIERSFGVLKARFGILKAMPSYSLRIQAYIVIACCSLHNFIRDEQIADQEFARLNGEDDLDEHQEEENVRMGNDIVQNENENSAGTAHEMNIMRRCIANQLARDNGLAQI